jgi:hypothetical protein
MHDEQQLAKHKGISSIQVESTMVIRSYNMQMLPIQYQAFKLRLRSSRMTAKLLKE